MPIQKELTTGINQGRLIIWPSPSRMHVTEYGFSPMPEEANTVEGSIVQPITDEGRLIE